MQSIYLLTDIYYLLNNVSICSICCFHFIALFCILSSIEICLIKPLCPHFLPSMSHFLPSMSRRIFLFLEILFLYRIFVLSYTASYQLSLSCVRMVVSTTLQNLNLCFLFNFVASSVVNNYHTYQQLEILILKLSLNFF